MQGFEFLDKNAFFNFARDPELTQDAFNIQKTLIQHPRRAEMVKASNEAFLSNPEFMKLYNEKYLPDFPTIEELNACPQGMRCC